MFTDEPLSPVNPRLGGTPRGTCNQMCQAAGGGCMAGPDWRLGQRGSCRLGEVHVGAVVSTAGTPVSSAALGLASPAGSHWPWPASMHSP